MFFKKKSKKYNNQIDNYTDKYANSFMLGIVYLIIIGLGYVVYKLFFE